MEREDIEFKVGAVRCAAWLYRPARAIWAPPYLLERKVRGIRCPILPCIAEDDDVNPPALGRGAAASAPDGELRLYPGGHYELCNEAVYERMAADQVEFLASRWSEAISSAPAAAAPSRPSPRRLR
jgi:pimeloyl-ACP methyl ester carboxylesterase